MHEFTDYLILGSKLRFFIIALAILLLGFTLSKISQKHINALAQRLNWQNELTKILTQFSFWSIIVISSVIAFVITMVYVFDFDGIFITANILPIIISIGKALLVFFLGIYAIKIITNVLMQFLKASKVQPTLHIFICSASKIFLFIVLIMVSLELLGIPTSSLVATLASAGLAISLSIKDHLSNLIGGVVILFSHPFEENDFVEIDGTSGKVSQIGLIYTVLKTFDNKTVFIPNNATAKAKIINHSTEEIRRVDMTFSIGYEDDYNKARNLILQIAEKTGLVLKNPEPYVRMSAHNASSIDLSCRLWTKWEDFYELTAQMNERVKTEFDKNHINIPFNQMDIHIVKNDIKAT